jgi:sn-glycerol 3-phosphate transport system substrate-binding protein
MEHNVASPCRIRRLGAVALATALLAAACGGGKSGGGSTATTAAAKRAGSDPAACGLGALVAAPKPVEIVFWHTMVRTNNDWLVSAINQFNGSQHDVHVTLRQQPSYEDLFTKYKAGLTSGDLPDVAQFEDTTVAQLVDSQSTMPVQDCIDASHYDLSDFLPRALQFYSFGGVQRSMPWSVSNIILYFDPGKFRKAGLDPSKPPATLDEVRQDSQKIVASGAATHGIALHQQPYLFEFLLAKSGGEYVNNGNGRQARATQANLTSPVAEQIWSWWSDMVRSGLALDTGSDPNNIDHLLAIATGNAAMTIEASGVIGPVEAVLASGQYKGVQIATAPLPALTLGGGVPVGDGSLWISAKSSPEKRAAAWKLIEFLDSPEQLAGLAAEGGYVPIRYTAVKEPPLVTKWAQDANYRAGYDQLATGTMSAANVGPLIGDYQGVRDSVRDGMTQMLQNHLSPSAAAALAEREANAKIQDYNSRVGTG